MRTLALIFALTVSAALAIPASAQVSDSFSGTSALTAPWTQTSASGYGLCTANSGEVRAGASSCLVIYTGASFTSNYDARIAFEGDRDTGPAVRMDTAGNGYVWYIAYNKIARYVSGGYSTDFGGGCPSPASGDTLSLSVNGTSITCKDVTSGTSATYTDTTYSAGAPGIFISAGKGLHGPFTAQSLASLPPTFTVSPAFVSPSASTVITLAGMNTTWTSNTVFTLSGSSLTSSISATSVAGATAATITIASGATGGDLTITDPSGASAVVAFRLPQTFYVRADGGTRYSAGNTAGQCTGKADAAYGGSGVNQPCAFGDYRSLYDDGTYNNPSGWAIRGGDTVIIDNTKQWRVGFDVSSGGDPNWCIGGGGSKQCVNSPIPAGTSTQHTRILGRNWATCHTGHIANQSQMTQLFGGKGVYAVLNMIQTQNVDIACLEITDHSNCYIGGDPAPTNIPVCTTALDYDSDGIEEDNTTANINMTDLWVHGHKGRGVKGPIGGPVTATNVLLSYNESAGWDFDDGSSTAMGAGAFWTFLYSTIEWSGCYQEYPIVDTYSATACYGQSNQGYGDGVGSAPGQWLGVNIDHAIFRYNVEDGEDFGHVDGGHTSFTVTNSQSYGNGGGQLKWGWGFDAITVENNLLVANCRRMFSPIGDNPIGGFPYADSCRSGDALSFNFNDTSRAVFANNTIVSYEGTTFDFKCVVVGSQTNCNDTVFNFRNNIVRAYGNPFFDYGGHSSPGGFCGASCNGATQQSTYNGNNGGLIGTITRDHNIFWGLNQTCIANTPTYDTVNATSANEQCIDPQFVSEPLGAGIVLDASTVALDNFNFALTSTSPAKGAGTAVAGLLTDYNGYSYSSPPSIGAFEYGSTGGTVVVTPPATTPIPCQPGTVVINGVMVPTVICTGLTLKFTTTP